MSITSRCLLTRSKVVETYSFGTWAFWLKSTREKSTDVAAYLNARDQEARVVITFETFSEKAFVVMGMESSLVQVSLQIVELYLVLRLPVSPPPDCTSRSRISLPCLTIPLGNSWIDIELLQPRVSRQE